MNNNRHNLSKLNNTNNYNNSSMSNRQLKENPGNVAVPLQSLHESLAVLHLLGRNVPEAPHLSAIDLPVYICWSRLLAFCYDVCFFSTPQKANICLWGITLLAFTKP
jgi:hypothetical protein